MYSGRNQLRKKRKRGIEMKNIRDNRLKPCPFCGGCAVLNRNHAAECIECGAKTESMGTDYGAISLWNKRVSND